MTISTTFKITIAGSAQWKVCEPENIHGLTTAKCAFEWRALEFMKEQIENQLLFHRLKSFKNGNDFADFGADHFNLPMSLLIARRAHAF